MLLITRVALMKGQSHPLQRYEQQDDWVNGSWTVDCPCGVNFDDGEEMVDCDDCGVWVHTRCSQYVKGDKSFVCEKCKTKNSRSDNEETEVAQLLAELPTKTLQMDNSYAGSDPARQSMRVPADLHTEERAHTQGIPGGDPALFHGLSRVFTPQLWKSTGYVPKKLNFQYREFPCWDRDDPEVENAEGHDHAVDNGAGVLLSLLRDPVATVVGFEGSWKGDYKVKMDSKEMSLAAKIGEVRHLNNGVKKERSSLLRPALLYSGKWKKHDLGLSKRRNPMKKSRDTDRNVIGKKRVRYAAETECTPSGEDEIPPGTERLPDDQGSRPSKKLSHDTAKNKSSRDHVCQEKNSLDCASASAIAEKPKSKFVFTVSRPEFPTAPKEMKPKNQSPASIFQSTVDSVVVSAPEGSDGGRKAIRQEGENMLHMDELCSYAPENKHDFIVEGKENGEHFSKDCEAKTSALSDSPSRDQNFHGIDCKEDFSLLAMKSQNPCKDDDDHDDNDHDDEQWQSKETLNSSDCTLSMDDNTEKMVRMSCDHEEQASCLISEVPKSALDLPKSATDLQKSVSDLATIDSKQSSLLNLDDDATMPPQGELDSHSKKFHEPMASERPNRSSRSSHVALNFPATTLSDEEIALLLHQELNSSPRVPRVPRMRNAGSLPNLIFSPSSSTSMHVKHASSSGAKDQSSLARRYCLSGAKNTEMLPLVLEEEVEDDKDAFDLQTRFAANQNAHPPGSSRPSSVDVDTLHLTLPALISQIMRAGRRMTYEELCGAVLPHWDNLRKHNGERYAYSSHYQAVLDCLRNRQEWSRLVDRGPKQTNPSRKKRKLDVGGSESEFCKEETSKEEEHHHHHHHQGLESQRDQFPKGKRKARKRRLVAFRGTEMEDFVKSWSPPSLLPTLAHHPKTHSSTSSQDSAFSDGQSQPSAPSPSLVGTLTQPAISSPSVQVHVNGAP